MKLKDTAYIVKLSKTLETKNLLVTRDQVSSLSVIMYADLTRTICVNNYYGYSD